MIGQYLLNTNEINIIHILQVKRPSIGAPTNQGLVYLHPKIQIFQDSPSHRIFKRMHEVLNIDENKN